MESFLRSRDKLNIEGTDEEKVNWLSKFYNHVEKYIFRGSLHPNCGEIAQSILKCLLNYKTETNDDIDDQKNSRCPQYHLVSLESLVKERDICAGQLAEDLCLSNSSPSCSIGYDPLTVKHPYLLLGFVTWCPSVLKSSAVQTSGTLFIEDNSSYLPIEIHNPDIKWLDQLVVLPSWTYVPVQGDANRSLSNPPRGFLSDSGYIEATSRCLPILHIPNDDRRLPNCLSLAHYKQRQRTGKKVVINLYGKVTAVSPIHCISNSTPFFFIQLSCADNSISTSVVIQGIQFMHWVHFLDMEKDYLFTAIRERIMNKGSRNERTILAATISSTFVEYQPAKELAVSKKRKLEDEETESSVENDSSLKRLKSVNSKPVSTVQTVEPETNKATNTSPENPLTLCYKGVITKCYSEIGTYQLNDKYKLYTVQQPCPNFGRGLRVGAEVSLYNVHLVKKDKKLLGLCCCTLSAVRITRFSPLVSEWKPSVFTASVFTLHGQSLSLLEYVNFVQATEKLLRKFSSMYRPSSLIGYSSSQRGKQSAVEKLLHSAKVKASSANPTQPRNIYQEFFDRPHQCYPTKHNSIDLTTVFTMDEVRNMVLEKSKEMSWESGTKDGTRGASDWLYQIIPGEQISQDMAIVGVLRASTTTGHLKVYDQTGNIPIVVPLDQTNRENTSLIDCRDCIVKIDKFQAVVEQFHSLQSFSTNQRTRIYLQATLSGFQTLTSKESRLTDHRNPEMEKTSNLDKRLTLVDDNNNGSKSSTSNSDPKALRDLSITCAVAKDVFECKILFFVRHGENLLLRKKKQVSYACAVDVKVLAFSSDEDQATEPTQEQVSNRFSGLRLKNKSVALRLQNQNVQWHPFLCEGCFYIMDERVTCKESSLIRRAMKYCAKPVLDVNPDMLINQVRIPSRDTADTGDIQARCTSDDDIAMAMKTARETYNVEDEMQSVETILSSNTDTLPQQDTNKKNLGLRLVNFRGRIVCRELRLSDTAGQLFSNDVVLVPKFGPIAESVVHSMDLGFGYLGNKTLFVRVQDLQSPNTVDVYIDVSRTPHIDGILPGAIISCRRFLCKLSRTGNIYCSFDACSCLKVEETATILHTKPASMATNTRSSACASDTLERPHMSSVPHRFLIDFIQCETTGGRIHTISLVRCRVTAVQRLSMRWQCVKCGHVIIREECSRGCTSSGGFVFSSEGKCLVDDGTAEAMVFLSKETIPTLLGLSKNEMSKLTSHAMNVGELVYQRYSYVYGNDNCKGDSSHLVPRHVEANNMLAAHCCSTQAKRPIMLYCKHLRNTKSNQDNASATEQGYESRTITINHTEYSTLILPKLFLKAVEITEVNYQEEIRRLLALCAHKTTENDPSE